MHKGSHKGISPAPPPIEPPAHVHLMGICGTAMATLAGMFQRAGFRVTGSDQACYPPMSDFLNQLGIPVMEGFRGENLQPRPDLVVVGNVIRKVNPEAVGVEQSGIPFTSFPRALIRYFAQDRTRVVVTGTHGKTTVSSMIMWILRHEGLDPGFMIGGVPLNTENDAQAGQGPHFVIEGDEYDTAYFDKRPKFLLYQPHVAVMTSVEFDHGDIYESLDEIQTQFQLFAGTIPEDGYLVFHGADARAREVAACAACRTESYGLSAECDWAADALKETDSGIEARITHERHVVAQGSLPMMGRHNVLNALASITIAARLGVEPERALKALQSFRGVKRRQQVLNGDGRILVIDDFAHHPTAVRLTCDAVRSRFPGRRLVAVFEPRTNTSRRSIFQHDYVEAFLAADLIALREPPNVEQIPESERFSSERLAHDLKRRNVDAHAFPDSDKILEFLTKALHDGDVVLIMSNGSFDNLATRLVDSLKAQRA
ncbi:MAG: UDP-N-acetylmuramate--L-alanine ligase [Thermodesulfobacteriota bacterium]